MKAVLLVLLYFTFLTGHGQANKQPVYRVQLTTHNGMQLMGVMTQVGDSSMQFVPVSNFRKGQLVGDPVLHSYPIKDIYSLQIRKSGAVARTAIFSGLVGFAVGPLVGWLTYEDPCASSSGSWMGCLEIIDKTASIVPIGSLGMVFGAGIGALAGSSTTGITYVEITKTITRCRVSCHSMYTRYTYPISDRRRLIS